jgi:anti-anti-sigma regulatory factor
MEGSVSHYPGVVALSGDLDTPQFVAVHGALAAALADDQPEIIVNLSAVRFLDAGTIRLSLEARPAAVDAGCG